MSLLWFMSFGGRAFDFISGPCVFKICVLFRFLFRILSFVSRSFDFIRGRFYFKDLCFIGCVFFLGGVLGFGFLYWILFSDFMFGFFGFVIVFWIVSLWLWTLCSIFGSCFLNIGCLGFLVLDLDFWISIFVSYYWILFFRFFVWIYFLNLEFWI